MEPLRPELYGFCGYLSRAPWDAEDALARAFVTLGGLLEAPSDARLQLPAAAAISGSSCQRSSMLACVISSPMSSASALR
jgi:RNA polymerase sigma-70 factor (ECF subfamily)